MKFVVNEIDPEILARDIMLLEIINSIEGDGEEEIEEDVRFLWAVWYNLKMSRGHYQRFRGIINR